MYGSMVQEKDNALFQFKSLRVCSGGGEPINTAVAKLWKQKTGIICSDFLVQFYSILSK